MEKGIVGPSDQVPAEATPLALLDDGLLLIEDESSSSGGGERFTTAEPPSATSLALLLFKVVTPQRPETCVWKVAFAKPLPWFNTS